MSTILPRITASEALPSVTLDSAFDFYKVKKNNTVNNKLSPSTSQVPKAKNGPDILNNNQSNVLKPEDHNYSFQQATQKSTLEAKLIGDFSRDCSLPIINGRNHDVATITCHTVAKLLRDEQQQKRFIICDCRYPYEYAGGHIKGAKNTYTRELLMKEFFFDDMPLHQGKMVIFYCEFSSRRGPSMYRYLRRKDRSMHRDSYPALFYPEMYVIEGGYKLFFMHYKILCEPCNYIEMKDKRFIEKLAQYRVKCREEENSEKYRNSRLSILY